MTKPRLPGAKPIEVTFTPCDVVAKPGDVPMLNVLGFGELNRHQAKEFDRVGAEIAERIEVFFQAYGVARTGDDLTDFRNLALQMALELFPHFRFKDDPALLELLFPLYGLLPGNGGVAAYRLLIVRMAETQGLLPIEKRP